jgi:hypothetical protein
MPIGHGSVRRDRIGSASIASAASGQRFDGSLPFPMDSPSDAAESQRDGHIRRFVGGLKIAARQSRAISRGAMAYSAKVLPPCVRGPPKLIDPPLKSGLI